MPEDASHITCDEFQQRICEFLASDQPIEEHLHYKSCSICRSLVSNFERMIDNTLGKHVDDAHQAGFKRSDDWPEST